MAVQVELEIQAGRRAFPVAQRLFAGAPILPTRSLEVGWYDSSVHPETGAFALVRDGAGLDDLIGEIVRVSFGGRSAFAYVVSSDATLATDFALARRAFCAICRLSAGTATCDVVVVDS